MHQRLFEYFQSKVEISTERFDYIKNYFSPKTIAKNELLLSAGQKCTSNYFVNEGCLRFYTLSDGGDEITRYFAFPGKFGTSLSSLIQQKPSVENIQALEETEVLEISKDDFYTLVETVPEVNLVYRNILEMAYVTSQERIYGLQGDSALVRLRWLMDYQPKIVARLPNKIIASYLGVTPFTLSRIKADL